MLLMFLWNSLILVLTFWTYLELEVLDKRTFYIIFWKSLHSFWVVAILDLRKSPYFLALASFFWLKIQKTCVWRELIYRKIPLRCPEHIYGQRTVGLYSGRWGGGAYIREENHFNCNLLNLLFFLISSIKTYFGIFSRRSRSEICSKLTIKTPD